MSEEEKPKLPDYLEMLPNGNVKVKTREGEFTLREPNGEEFDSVQRIAKNTPTITEWGESLMLVARSLVEPKVGDLELKQKYKISTLKRLTEGVNLFVNEEQSFLWDTVAVSSTTTGNPSSAESPSDSTKQ